MVARTRRQARPARRGASLVLFSLMLVVVLGMVAFAVDVGCLSLVRTQLQVAADSAALAAAASMEKSPCDPVAVAQRYASQNWAGGKAVELAAADVELGHWDFGLRTFVPSGTPTNAIRVTARRDRTAGGEVPLLFARVLGARSCGIRAQAVAVFVSNFQGFRRGLGVLPLAIDKGAADALVAGSGTDQWSWDPETGTVSAGADGEPEASMYPGDKPAPGNFGTINIGGKSNSTATLSRQIRDGLTAEDLAPYGGKFELGADGTLTLQGNPGLSAGIEDALSSVVGQARIAPIYSQVVDQGANAEYTLVGFLGIRIVNVDLKGAMENKRVLIQAGRLLSPDGIPATGPGKSHWVYAPVHLVQ